MTDITKAVSDAFDRIIASGAIEKAIEENLTKTINETIRDQLRTYSEFGKKLDEAIKAAMQVDFSHLGLAGYNDLILKIVRAQVDAGINTVLAQQVEEQMNALLMPAPAEIKLSKLVADFIEHSKSDYSCSCDGPTQISLHVDESSYGSRWVSMDKDEGKSQYQCSIRFGVHEEDGKIFALRIDGVEAGKTLFVGPIYNFERDLFQMYAAGTKLIIDAEAYEIDTHYPGHGD